MQRLTCTTAWLALAAALCLLRPAGAQPPPEKLAVKGQVVNALTGEPLSGARVIVSRQSDNATRSLQRNADTDVEGRFAVEDMPEGRYGLSVSCAGFASASQSLDLNPRSEPVVLKLTPYSTIRGTVRRPDGAPLALAEVALQVHRTSQEKVDQFMPFAAGGMRRSQVTTDDEGRYETRAETDGEFLVFALCVDAGLGVSATHTCPGGGTVEGIDVALTEGQKIRLKVLDEATNQPLMDAWVSLSAGPYNMSMMGLYDKARKRAANGEATFTGLPAGPHRVKIECPGYGDVQYGQIQLFPGQAERLLAVPMRRTGALVAWGGRVLSPEVQPVPNTEVQFVVVPVAQPGMARAYCLFRTTAADGRFSLSLPDEGPWTVWAIAPGAGVTAETNVAAINGRTSETLLQLEPACSIGGTVTDENDQPVAGTKVQFFRYVQTNGGYLRDWPQEFAVTGKDGRYECVDLPPGPYWLRLDLRGVGGDLTKSAYLKPRQRLTKEGFQVIRAGATVAGRVWEPGRKRAMADLTVSALLLDKSRLPARVLWSTTTKLQNGAFRLAQVLPRPGYLLLLGWEPGYAFTDRLPLDEQRFQEGLELELQPGGVISVPAADNRYPSLFAKLPDGEFARLPAPSGRNENHHDFKGLPPGEYWLSWTGDAEKAVRCEVKVGETTRVKLPAEK
jgi:5-hydroxyisourate hydrolase-like protein (transthyretin family)